MFCRRKVKVRLAVFWQSVQKLLIEICSKCPEIELPKLPPPQALPFSRNKAGEGELEAQETGDKHARDHGKEKEERRNILSPSLLPLRAHHFRSERDVWERGRLPKRPDTTERTIKVHPTPKLFFR